METHRKPAVAGMFYTGDPQVLKQEVAGFIDESTKVSDQQVKFIIVPHAGYIYSGRIAGKSFAEIEPANYEKVILLGPSHRYSFRGAAESEEQYWSFPIGEAKIAAVNHPQVIKDSRYHQMEHCLEVQMPFLLHLLPDAKYSPILLSGSYQSAAKLADLLIELDDDKTLWVISSDFNHVGPNFNHFPQKYGYGSGEAMDMQAIDHIVAGDISGLIGFMEQTDATICGALPILTAMNMIQSMNRPEFTFKSYDCSGNQTRDKNSVGYAALFS
ncbi:MAG: AmmeMemoRadiSam system protein B [Proteobacteria bacterium]|nr:AmmeMemoRadiSam system protein B [Pseudomonadota bacterium]